MWVFMLKKNPQQRQTYLIPHVRFNSELIMDVRDKVLEETISIMLHWAKGFLGYQKIHRGKKYKSYFLRKIKLP